jgi:hypothetical protein
MSESLPAVRVGKKDGTNIVYYPDGSTETFSLGKDAIEAAHDYLPSDGGTIKLQPGTYLSEANYDDIAGTELKITKPNVTLIGPRNAEFKLKDNVTNAGEGGRMIEWTGNFGTVFGITINGNIQNNGGFGNTTGQSDGHNITGNSEAFRFISVKSINSTGDGIEHGGKRSVIAFCHFEDNEEQDVHFQGGANVTVANNVMVRCRYNGSINTFSSPGNTPEGHKIVDNTFIEPQTEVLALGHGNATNIKDIEFSHNTVIGGASGVAMVRTLDEAGTIEGLTVTDNITRGTPYGINNQQTSDLVSDTTIKDNKFIEPQVGIEHNANIDGLVQTGNEIKRAGDTAVKLLARNGITDFRVEDIIRDPNQNASGSHGVILNEFSGGFEEGVIECDIVSDGSTLPVHGITVAAGSYSNVRAENNTIRGVQTNKINNPYRLGYVRKNTPPVFLSQTPKNEAGNWYWDDGTNTSSGTSGKRVYLDGSWVDAFSA